MLFTNSTTRGGALGTSFSKNHLRFAGWVLSNQNSFPFLSVPSLVYFLPIAQREVGHWGPGFLKITCVLLFSSYRGWTGLSRRSYKNFWVSCVPQVFLPPHNRHALQFCLYLVFDWLVTFFPNIFMCFVCFAEHEYIQSEAIGDCASLLEAVQKLAFCGVARDPTNWWRYLRVGFALIWRLGSIRYLRKFPELCSRLWITLGRSHLRQSWSTSLYRNTAINLFTFRK